MLTPAHRFTTQLSTAVVQALGDPIVDVDLPGSGALHHGHPISHQPGDPVVLTTSDGDPFVGLIASLDLERRRARLRLLGHLTYRHGPGHRPVPMIPVPAREHGTEGYQDDLPPGGRWPYVEDGTMADRCLRSAQIDDEEAQTLDAADPRVQTLQVSAARWRLQAAWHQTNDPKEPQS